MPFETTHVIHPDWSAHHAPVAEGAMYAVEVTIGASTGGGYDSETDDTGGGFTDEYTGPARVQAVNQSTIAQQAAQTIYGRLYLVQLPIEAKSADLSPGRRVHVNTSENDPRLTGQDFWVLDEQFGSEGFTRDLVCSDNQTDVTTP